MSIQHNTQPLFVDVADNTRYQVMTKAQRESDGVEMVVYRSLAKLDEYWVRPASEFYDGRFTAL